MSDSPTLIVTRGLPASGKSTRAIAWVAEDPQRRARVNRDSLRAMAHDGMFIPLSDDAPGTEASIVIMQRAAIKALLESGVSAVCDDTNLPEKFVTKLRDIAIDVGADFEVWDMTDVPPSVCIERDAKRDKPVGEKVIMGMYSDAIEGQGYPLPLPDAVNRDEYPLVPYEAVYGAPKAVLVDIDGTLSLLNGRNPYDFTKIARDVPYEAVVSIIESLADTHEIVIMSGRSDECRDDTVAWLNLHLNLPHGFHGPYMRTAGDERKDWLVKYELFDKHVRHNFDVTVAFDDRNQVVSLWRDVGLPTMQVADGDF